MARSSLALSLLGGFECRAGDGRALVFPTWKVRALLAYLALTAGRRHPRDKLAGLFWSDQTDARARANLRQTLSRLRRALPPRARAGLDLDGRGLALRARGLAVDVARFETLAGERTPASLARAAGLYRGPLLEGAPDFGEAFDAWLTAERQRLHEAFRQVLGRLLDHCVRTGAVDRGIQLALRVLALDPLDEGVHRTLMRLYRHQDRVSSAIEQYERCREVLRRELGVRPAADTERLRKELLGLLPPGGPIGDAAALSGRVARERPVAPRPARVRAGRPSVVVLALAGEEPDEGQQRLAEGVAEDVATELGRFGELDVVAPATALAYRQAAVPPERVGAELGAMYVLDGRLRTDAGRLRITVRLIETATGRQRWAERYDCARADLFDVQDDVVRRIVGTIAGRIERARLETARRARAEDREAYDLWLEGWSTLKRADLAAIQEARECFRRSATKDPGFARAYSGLALTLLTEWICFSWNPWVFMQPAALDLARKAVALDDRDHRAHCILGVAQLYARDWEGARLHLLRALDLNPNDADVLAHAAFGMALLGEHHLAVETGRRALRLQPYHPDWYAGLIGIALFGARRHEEAIRTMAPAPEAFCSAPAFIAAAHAHLGRAEACEPYRDAVYRHYRLRLRRGEFPAGTGCIGWLLGIDPFRLPADAEHYERGLRRAGFD